MAALAHALEGELQVPDLLALQVHYLRRLAFRLAIFQMDIYFALDDCLEFFRVVPELVLGRDFEQHLRGVWESENVIPVDLPLA